MTGIKVCANGHLATETEDWDSYWRALRELGYAGVETGLDGLECTWRQHIRSHFALRERQEFCFSYFSLLATLLSNYDKKKSSLWIRSFRAVLGFECFGIADTATSDPSVLCAGTSTFRNPCYLLAKLKMPKALDDPQFLPLVTVASSEEPELFYHYRQYALATGSGKSLLLYPIVLESKRSASFRLLNSLINGLSDGIDPWTHERARLLSRRVVLELLRASRMSEHRPLLDLVDVGAGSGSLVAAICRQLQTQGAAAGFVSKFRLWFVDLQPADPTRFFCSGRFRGLVDSMTYLGDDYRHWLSGSQPLPECNNLRIIFISKLLDVMSRICVHRLSSQEYVSVLGKAIDAVDVAKFSPRCCLVPGGTGAESLAVSNSRVVLENGRVLVQPSLSEFYRGLALMTGSGDLEESGEDAVFLPSREFNPECLVTSDGGSVISRIIENGDYVVIEDADLSPRDLIAHLMEFSLDSICVKDMTKSLRLSGNSAYVLWSKAKGDLPDLRGERIW